MAVRPMLIATSATLLRGMSGVNLDHLDATRLCFVLDKRVELGKTPTVQTALILRSLALPSAHLGGVPDVREVFQDDGAAFWRALDNVFGQDVIVVFASPKLFPRELAQVAFRAGLNWSVIEKKWPDIKRAMANFSINAVANFDAEDIDRLLKDDGMIRSAKEPCEDSCPL